MAAMAVIWGVVALAFSHAALAQTAAPAAGPPQPVEIVVKAAKGLAPSEEPLEQLSESEVMDLGVDTATELLRQLQPRTASSMSTQQPIVLVNGRLAGTTELDNLSPEEILRVDILPEKSALRYGFDDTQKVVNFILRDHYRGGVAGVSEREATEGGGQSTVADASAGRVEHDAEASARLDYRDSARLLERARGIQDPDSAARTLLPDASEEKLGVTVVHPWLSLRPLLEASVDVRSGEALEGLDDTLTPPGQIAQHTGSTALHLAGRVTGPVGKFIWSVALIGNENRSQERVADGGAPLDRGAYTLDTGHVQATLGGPLLRLPAGPVMVNTRVDAQLEVIRTQDQSGDEPQQRTRLSRTTGSAQARVRLPLTSRDLEVLPKAGEWTARASLGADEVSQLGTLRSYSYGLTFSPVDKVYFNADETGQRLAPTLQNLRGPVVSTPGVELFDFVTGATDYVTQVTGGNPELAPTSRSDIRLGVYLGTFFGESSFYANYERRRDRNAAGTLPPLTAAVEAAFPDRVVRDSDGTLVELDERPVNLALEARDVLTWGVNLGLPFPPGPPGPHGPQGDSGRTTHGPQWHLTFSLQDTWYLHDTVQVAPGVPELDLLGGAPLGATPTSTLSGAQPQHSVQLWATLNYGALGVQLSGRWLSGSQVDGGTPALPQNLSFAPLGTLNLRVFADVGRLRGASAGPWTRGLRVSVALNNLFDSRQRVTDASGATPVGFAPGYRDPLGRVVMLSLRKSF